MYEATSVCAWPQYCTISGPKHYVETGDQHRSRNATAPLYFPHKSDWSQSLSGRGVHNIYIYNRQQVLGRDLRSVRNVSFFHLWRAGN